MKQVYIIYGQAIIDEFQNNWNKNVAVIVCCDCVHIVAINRCVLAPSVERPPHNREVVGSIPGRVIPKDVKRWELLLPCLAFNI